MIGAGKKPLSEKETNTVTIRIDAIQCWTEKTPFLHLPRCTVTMMNGDLNVFKLKTSTYLKPFSCSKMKKKIQIISFPSSVSIIENEFLLLFCGCQIIMEYKQRTSKEACVLTDGRVPLVGERLLLFGIECKQDPCQWKKPSVCRIVEEFSTILSVMSHHER